MGYNMGFRVYVGFLLKLVYQNLGYTMGFRVEGLSYHGTGMS